MNDIIYSIWVGERDLARQIRKLQAEGCYIQSVKIVKVKYKPVYEIDYTNIINSN